MGGTNGPKAEIVTGAQKAKIKNTTGILKTMIGKGAPEAVIVTDETGIGDVAEVVIEEDEMIENDPSFALGHLQDHHEDAVVPKKNLEPGVVLAKAP